MINSLNSSQTIRMRKHANLYGHSVFAGDVVTLPAQDARKLVSMRRAENCLNDQYPTYNARPREVVFRVTEDGQVEVCARELAMSPAARRANNLEANAS